MGKPTWRPISTITVPDPPRVLWTLALDHVVSGKLLKLEVVNGDWTPSGFTTACSADGDPTGVTARSRVLGTAPTGALIAKIGGSTADAMVDITTVAKGKENGDKNEEKNDGAPAKIFSVGRTCVLQVPKDVSGALYLGVNDDPKVAGELKGQLTVTISEAL